MNIRKAEPQDVPTLSTLSVDVQRLHANQHPEIFKPVEAPNFAEEFFRTQLQDSKTHIFIAEQNGQALGYILCKLAEHPETVFMYENRYLFIDQLSVSPDKQGQGIGKALMARAKILAKELGVKRLQLHTWAFNTKAHGFFEHEDYTKFMVRYWLNTE